MAVKRVLITGISGFVGSHLAERLTEEGGFEIYGTHIHDDLDNLSSLANEVFIQKCDLLDRSAVVELVKEIRPDTLYHLAAFSAPSLSYDRSEEVLGANTFMTLNLLEAVAKESLNTVFVNVGSADVYGEVPIESQPVQESTEFRPRNPYAVSKAAQELLGYQYYKSRGLKVVMCRPFNHTGARQSDSFVVSSFARQIAEIEKGLCPEKVIRVGNLDSSRDFLHVRDVVSAYILLAESGQYGLPYNIASGRVYTIKELIEGLLSLSDIDIELVTDPDRVRAVDTSSICGDSTRLCALGWSPLHTVEEALAESLNYWREREVI